MQSTFTELVSLDKTKMSIVEDILTLADKYKENVKKGVYPLKRLEGKKVANLFFEPSTRTRLSFESAAKNMGASVLSFDTKSSSVVKGESLKDTVKNVEALGVDCLIIRHSLAGAPARAATAVNIPVINAGDGCHQHPTQGLLDIFTLRQELGKNLKGVKFLLVGDLRFSRVTRSLLSLLNPLGVEVWAAAPPTLLPAGLEKMGVRVRKDFENALKEADVVYMLRIQKERQQGGLFPSLKEYASIYGLNEKRMDLLNDNVIVLHPGPVNIGVEMTGAVMDHPRTLIQKQVENGVFVRMAILDLLLKGGSCNNG